MAEEKKIGFIELEANAEIPKVERKIIKIKIPEEWAKIKIRGYEFKDILKMSLRELAEKVLNARGRRTILRALEKGFSHEKEVLLEKVIKAQEGKYKRNIRTHARDMLILPIMVGLTIYVYNGKEFLPVRIIPEMIGHYLGEFSLTRKRVQHGEPGIKATRSTLHVGKK